MARPGPFRASRAVSFTWIWPALQIYVDDLPCPVVEVPDFPQQVNHMLLDVEGMDEPSEDEHSISRVLLPGVFPLVEQLHVVLDSAERVLQLFQVILDHGRFTPFGFGADFAAHGVRFAVRCFFVRSSTIRIKWLARASISKASPGSLTAMWRWLDGFLNRPMAPAKRWE